MISRLRPTLHATAAFLLVVAAVFAAYLLWPRNVQIADSIWAPYVATSLLYDHDPYLDEYRPFVEQWDFFAAFESRGHIHSLFPVGGQFLILPPLKLIDLVYRGFSSANLQNYLLTHPPTDPGIQGLQLLNAALLVALSAGVMFLVGREFLRPPYALLLAATYAFATSAYSTASRVLWQHGPSLLLLSIVLLLLIKARRRPVWAAVAGFFVAAAFIVRPTNSIAVLVVSLYVLARHRRIFLAYLLCALLLAVPFLLTNLNLYGDILPPYFAAGRLGSDRFGEALLGNLISPGRGVLVFSPILLLLPVGLWLKRRRDGLELLDGALLLVLLLHWIVISSFQHWWAGHSFGPRFFSDVMPLAVYFLIPILQEIQAAPRSAMRLRLGGAYAGLLLLSVGIHFRGATSPATFGWNTVPANVDEQPDRVWDWDDLQFIRGLSRRLAAVKPEQLVVAAGYQQPATLRLGSLSDDAFGLTLLLPARVSLAEESGWSFEIDPLPGGGQFARLREPVRRLGMWPFELDVDATATGAGQSLPAIQLSVERFPADPAAQVEVIPVSAGPIQGNIARPADVRVTCATAAPGELLALFGAGWYDEEAAGAATWRWAGSPAFLYLWSDAAQTVTVELLVSSLHVVGPADGLGDEGLFRVTLPDGTQPDVDGRAGQPLALTAHLIPGWNVIALELAAGNFRPSELVPGHFDARALSFSVDEVRLTGACRTGP